MDTNRRSISAFSSRRARTVFACAALGVLWCAVLWARRDYLAFRITTITEGKVWQSGAMPAGELRELVLERRIRTVVDLRFPQESGTLRLAFQPLGVAAERQLLESLGVTYVNVRSDQLPTEETVERFLTVARDPDSYPLLVHCWHGTGRSVLLAAIYRIEIEGWSAAEALDAAAGLQMFGSFRRAGSKSRYLLAYEPRLRQRAPLEPRPSLTISADR